MQSPARILFDIPAPAVIDRTPNPLYDPNHTRIKSPTCGRQNSFIKTFIQIVNGRKVGSFARGAQAVLVHPSCRFHGSSRQAPPEIKNCFYLFFGFNQLPGRKKIQSMRVRVGLPGKNLIV